MLKCLLGMHDLGLARTDASGVTKAECLNCLRMVASPVSLTPDAAAAESLNTRRDRSIAELVSASRWVGIPVKQQAPVAIAAEPVRAREAIAA